MLIFSSCILDIGNYFKHAKGHSPEEEPGNISVVLKDAATKINQSNQEFYILDR